MAREEFPQGRGALGADLVIPVLALAFAGYFFYSVEGLPWEARANGDVIGTALVALVAIQLGRIGWAVVRQRERLGFAPILEPREALPKRLGIVLVSACFLLALPWLGLTLSLFLAMAAALWVMGVRKRTQLVAIPLVASLVAYALFIAVLRSDFEPGPVERALAPILAKVRS